jgi:hypothetical protein
LCENCKRAPAQIPGARGAAGKYCAACIHEKWLLISDVFEVIKHFGVAGE